MGLFAVIGPSRKDQRGPFALCSRCLSKIRCSSQKRSISRSMVGKSGTFGTGLYMFINNIVSADVGASVPARAPAVHGGRDVASYASTGQFLRNREWLMQDYLCHGSTRRRPRP